MLSAVGAALYSTAPPTVLSIAGCLFVSENSGLPLVALNSRKSSMVGDLLSRREVARRLLGVTAAWSLGGLHPAWGRSEEHTSELQSHVNLVCRLLLEK